MKSGALSSHIYLCVWSTSASSTVPLMRPKALHYQPPLSSIHAQSKMKCSLLSNHLPRVQTSLSPTVVATSVSAIPLCALHHTNPGEVGSSLSIVICHSHFRPCWEKHLSHRYHRLPAVWMEPRAGGYIHTSQ